MPRTLGWWSFLIPFEHLSSVRTAIIYNEKRDSTRKNKIVNTNISLYRRFRGKKNSVGQLGRSMLPE